MSSPLHFAPLSQELQISWENNEEQDGGGDRAVTDPPIAAPPRPSETLTISDKVGDNEPQQPRSAGGEKDKEKVTERRRDKEKQRKSTVPWSHSVVAPSSGHDRAEGSMQLDRKWETRTERHRDRERRDGERQKSSKRSKQETREEERRRDWERSKMTAVQRRNPPSYSHSSSLLMSHETDRRDWQRRGGQCSSNSSSLVRNRGSSLMSNPTNLPDVSLNLKGKDNERIRPISNQGPSVDVRDKYKPARAHHALHSYFRNHGKDRDLMSSDSLGGPQRGSPDWEVRQSRTRSESRGERGERKPEKVLKAGKEGKREAEHQEVALKRDGGSRREDKPEERQRPSSSSSSARSSASRENTKDKRDEKEKQKTHKNERRHTVPELQEEETRKQQHKKSKSSKDGMEEETPAEAGNR